MPGKFLRGRVGIVPVIPSSRRTDWTYAGVPGGIPNRQNVYATYTAADSVATINAGIVACSAAGGGVVALASGTYDLTSVIQLHSSNVTLRGAGVGSTILRGGTILRMGTGSVANPSITITSGGAPGTFTIGVSSVSGLSVGQLIEASRNDDADFVYSTRGDAPTDHLRQINRIAAIDGLTLTVQNPWWIDLQTGSPQLKWKYTHISSSGIEDLTLDHSTSEDSSSTKVEYCYGCWIKNVESYKAVGFHFQIVGTCNLEVRDSYIHDAQTYGPNNAGLAVYGTMLYGVNSSGKIENNVFDKLFPAVELQYSSSGFAVLYNYMHGTMSTDSNPPATWSMTDNHGAHDMMNLWEGNVCELWGADGYFGSSSHSTLARNYITGYNPHSTNTSDPVRLNRLSYYYNLVGNVLGSPALDPQHYLATEAHCGDAVYRLGHPNIGNCSLTDSTGLPVSGMTYPDAKVSSTLLRWGNYDYYNDAARYESSELPSGVPVPTANIPNSYYYSTTPSWWTEGLAWPPIGPDVTGGNGGGNGTADTSGHVYKIPAQTRFEAL